MKFLVVDNTQKNAEQIKNLILSTIENAVVDIEVEIEEGCYAVERKEYSAVITETKRVGFDGLEFARMVHDRAPNTKVIFITEHKDYAVSAFKTRAVGYLVKPISSKALLEELMDLNIYGESQKHKIEVKTFGNFEMFCDGKIVKFGRSKSKELLAFLIDKNGTTASGSEIIVNLWEEKDVDRTTRSMLHNLVGDIKKTLQEYGILDIFETKRNTFWIKKDKIICDYFDLLDGKEDAKRKFKGDYMYSYAWAEFTIGSLYDLIEKDKK